MTIAKEYPYTRIQAVTIKAWVERKSVIKRITGTRNCQTLLALYENQKRGITALEMGTWAYRLGGYIHVLRQEYGMGIETRMEPHDGGKHARYFLQTPTEILEME